MIKKRKGVTLVELMIVLALLSVVIMIAFSVLSFGLKGFNAQTDNTDNQSKVRYAIGDISKEIRSVDATITKLSDDTINIVEINVDVNEIDVNGVIYKLQGNVLLKNGNKLASGIKLFKPSIEGKKITLDITSEARRGREFKLKSEIYIRE